MSTGVSAVVVSREERYGKMYISWMLDGVIGKDPGGSFDSVLEIDSRRADRRASETSATLQ